MDERRLEIRVGLLLVVAAAAALALLYGLGEFQIGGGHRVFADFAHSGGVPVGAPLKLAGVRVGRVKALHLFPQRRDGAGALLPVQMELEVSRRAFDSLHADARVAVATQGALGEPYLELLPGSPGAAKLTDGASLRGVDPARLDVLAQRLYDFLDTAMTAVNNDPKALSDLLRGAGNFASTAGDVLRENRESLERGVREFADAAADLRALLGKDGALRRLADDSSAVASSLRRDLPSLAERANRAAAGAAAVAGGFTEQDGKALKEAVARYEKAGQQLEAVADRADAVLRRVEAGEGSLGGFYKDPKVYQDLKALVADLRAHPWKMLWKD